MIDVICCIGNNEKYYKIANDAGMKYGARLPAKIYGPLFFADQNWKKPDRVAYMSALEKHKPEIASVLDLEQKSQLPDVLSWAEEASKYSNRIIIIPKAHGIITSIPRRIGSTEVVLGYSIPTTHGGTKVWPDEFSGWPIHLLGGSPQSQIKEWSRMSRICEVVSADGNMMLKMSHRCMFWSREKGSKGHWIQLNEVGLGHLDYGANTEAFRMSCKNIAETWRDLCK